MPEGRLGLVFVVDVLLLEGRWGLVFVVVGVIA